MDAGGETDKGNYVTYILLIISLTVAIGWLAMYYICVAGNNSLHRETRKNGTVYTKKKVHLNERKEERQLREKLSTNQNALRQTQSRLYHKSDSSNARHDSLSKRKIIVVNALPSSGTGKAIKSNYQSTNWTPVPVSIEKRNRLQPPWESPIEDRLSDNRVTQVRESDRHHYSGKTLDFNSEQPVSWQMGYPQMFQKRKFVYLFSRLKNEGTYLFRQGICNETATVPHDYRLEKDKNSATFNMRFSTNRENLNRFQVAKPREINTDCKVCAYWGSRHTYIPRHNCTRKLKTATEHHKRTEPTVLRLRKVQNQSDLNHQYVRKASDHLKTPGTVIATKENGLPLTTMTCTAQFRANANTNGQTRHNQTTTVVAKACPELKQKRKDLRAAETLENKIPSKTRKLHHDENSEIPTGGQTSLNRGLHSKSHKENEVSSGEQKTDSDKHSVFIIRNESIETNSHVPVTSNSQENVLKPSFVNTTYVDKSMSLGISTGELLACNSVSVGIDTTVNGEASGETKIIQNYETVENSTDGNIDTSTEATSNSITADEHTRANADEQRIVPTQLSEHDASYDSRGYDDNIPACNIITSEIGHLGDLSLPHSPSQTSVASSNEGTLTMRRRSELSVFVNTSKGHVINPRATDTILPIFTQPISTQAFDATAAVTNGITAQSEIRSGVLNTQSLFQNAQTTSVDINSSFGGNSNPMEGETDREAVNRLVQHARCQSKQSQEKYKTIAAKPYKSVHLHTEITTCITPILRKPSHEIITDPSWIDHLEGVYFDLETTGFELDCEIVQLAAIFKDNEFDNYIMPSIRMRQGASEITKITIVNNVMYHDGKPVHPFPPQQAFQNFIDWLQRITPDGKQLVLYAHNAKTFDVPRMLNHLDKFNLLGEFQKTVIGFVDTLPLFKAMKHGLKSHKLSSLAEHFLDNSTYDAHNALADVEILKSLTTCIRPSAESLQKYSMKTEAAIKVARFSLQALQRKHTLKRLVNGNGISKDMIKKMAESGLDFNQLKLAYESDRDNGIANVLSATGCDGEVRVTKTKSVIVKVQQFFQSLIEH